MNFGSSLLQIKCKTILLVQGLNFDRTLGYSSDGQCTLLKHAREYYFISVYHVLSFGVENSVFQSQKIYIYFYYRAVFSGNSILLLFFVGCFKKTAMSVIAGVFINDSTLNCAALLQ